MLQAKSHKSVVTRTGSGYAIAANQTLDMTDQTDCGRPIQQQELVSLSRQDYVPESTIYVAVSLQQFIKDRYFHLPGQWI